MWSPLIFVYIVSVFLTFPMHRSQSPIALVLAARLDKYWPPARRLHPIYICIRCHIRHIKHSLMLLHFRYRDPCPIQVTSNLVLSRPFVVSYHLIIFAIALTFLDQALHSPCIKDPPVCQIKKCHQVLSSSIFKEALSILGNSTFYKLIS